MDDKRQFLKLLAPVRRQLRLARIFAAAQYGLASAGAGCVIVLLLARMVVFPYYYEAAAVCSILAFLSVFLFFIRRLPGWKEAAGLYNSYVPEDRVMAAHSFQDQDGPIEKLLIKETVSYMKRERARVLSRKKKYRITKWFAAGILLAAAALSLEQFPNKKIELAEKRKTEIAIVKKAEENISTQMKKQKNPLAKKELEELKMELAKARTPEEALNTIERKKKELVLKELKEKDLNSGLESLITEMEEAGLKKLASAIAEKDVEKAMAEIGRLSKDGAQRTPAQSAALKKLVGTDGALSGKQLDSLRKKIEESFQSGNELRELAALQDTVTKQGQMLRGEMAAKGLLRGTLAMGPEKNIHNGQVPSAGGKGKNDLLNSGKDGTQSGSSPNTGSTPGSGSRNGKGNGTGTSVGTGAGQGTGASGGKGAGSSAGQGGNPGKGAGLGEGPREFLTIPDKIGGTTNLESDFGKLGEGNTSQYESDGPVQRGTIRPYEEVYGEYADSYRNSLDRMKLPGGLENIVKNYFSELDPKKE